MSFRGVASLVGRCAAITSEGLASGTTLGSGSEGRTKRYDGRVVVARAVDLQKL